MGDFRITVEDPGGLIPRLLASDDIFATEAETEIRRASLDGEARSKRVIQAADRIDLGQMLGSVVADPVRRQGTTVTGGWGTSARHALVNEEGRRAGARMPPSGALLPWMARHGIPAEREFVVRRAIGRRGIPGIFFMRTARDEVEPRFRAGMRAAVARALRRIGGGR